jgi:hypothetical protein
LTVDSAIFIIDTMQKNLLTHPPALYSLLKALYNRNSTQLFAGIAFLLTVLSSLSAAAQGQTEITASYIRISGIAGGKSLPVKRFAATRPTGNLSPDLFSGQYLGVFDQAYNSTTQVSTSDSLYIDGEATTLADTADNVQSVQLLYRVFRTDMTGEAGVPLPLPLAFQSGVTTGGSAKWSSLNSRTNLLNSTAGPGNYTVVIYFQAGVSSDSTKSTIDDNPNGLDANGNPVGYQARFNLQVNGSFYAPASWAGGSTVTTNSWFVASNWSNNRVPNSNTDVTIPVLSSGNYPSINDGSPSARVHNLVLSSRSGNRTGAILRITSSQLYVSGNFQDTGNGFTQTGGLFSLNGRGDQNIIASPSVKFAEITGGGRKILSGVMTVKIGGSLTFLPSTDGRPSGILITGSVVEDPNSNDINQSQAGVLLLADARLIGEYEGGYVQGRVRTDRTVGIGSKNNFGNIGVELTANSGIPGTTTVTRYSYVYTGTGSSTSIKRGFTIEPTEETIQSFDLVFHYLKNELNGITTNNLRLYRSSDGEITFDGLDKTSVDTVAKTLTRTGISGALLATFTLGNVENPLPVKLVSFTAVPTAEGAALLHWLTASELNNKGFAIERQLSSTDAWQQVGYVAAGKTPKGNTYEFTDKSLIVAPVSTQAYYRLRQEDYNGEVSYSPVAVITRKPGQLGSDLVLSPVPVDGTNLSVAFAEANQAGVEISVINTQGQNVLRLTTAASGNPSVSLPVTSLASGMYILRVQAPGQAVRHARFVKL